MDAYLCDKETKENSDSHCNNNTCHQNAALLLKYLLENLSKSRSIIGICTFNKIDTGASL